MRNTQKSRESMCKGPGVRKEDKRENQKEGKCRWSRENNGDCGQEEVGRG